MSQFESQFEEKFYLERREKLEKIAALGARSGLLPLQATYPSRFRFSTDVPSIRARYDAPQAPVSTEQLEADPPHAALAGRIVALRLQGKAGFATLLQGGQRLQIYVRKDDVGEDAFELYKLLDLGDHIGVSGHLMRTRTGELTLKVGAPSDGKPALTLLAKAMLPLPDKFSGLGDIELRYRRRYLDLFTDTGDLAEPTPISSPEDALKGPASTPSVSSPEDALTGTASNPSVSSPEDALKGTASNPSVSSPEGALKGTASNPSVSSPEGALKGTASSPSLPSPEGALKGTASNPSVSSPEGALKGTGFSPSVADAKEPGALAPEGAAPQQTRLPARTVFEKRAAILRSIRHFFDTRGYIEVETPMLHTIASGAAARTFSTHHNAEDMDLTLRIAPELHLKRLVVGGFDRVYEINRNFRNEGVDTTHNPEFTMLEFYQAYSDYHDLMDLTEELIQTVAMEVNGTMKTNFNGVEIDLSKWTRLSMSDAIVKWWPPEAMPSPGEADFQDIGLFQAAIMRASDAFEIQAGGVYEYSSEKKTVGSKMAAFSKMAGEVTLAVQQVPSSDGDYERNYAAYQLGLKNLLGKQIAATFELLAEEHLIQPTIIYDFPRAVSPLSKAKPDEPEWVERFEFYIGGFEVGNAFSELNDPEDQRNRFLDQLQQKERGDDEAMAMDEDYVRALGYGLPPTAGEGIGIDRLTMLLTGSRSIRDVILFPLMRSKSPTP